MNNVPKGATHFSTKTGGFFLVDFTHGLHYWSRAREIWKKAHSHPDDLAPIHQPEAGGIAMSEAEISAEDEADRAADKARIAELESALSECAASLAWNCFGECRAVHDGPIMPAQMALEHARAALAAAAPEQPAKEQGQ